MNVQINAVGFSVAAPLHAYVNEKIGKLDKYNDQIISMEVFLKLEKDDNAENKVVEVKVDVREALSLLRKMVLLLKRLLIS